MLTWATGAMEANQGRVRIYYQQGPRVHMDGTELEMALKQASRLLAEAGIPLEWRSGKPRDGEKDVRVIPMKFVPNAPESLAKKQNILAESTLFHPGGSVAVFGDRVTLYLSYCQRDDRWKVLGHILAHEIVHVLEGSGQHSETGLMKAHWSAIDLRYIEGTGLELAEEDRALLRGLF